MLAEPETVASHRSTALALVPTRHALLLDCLSPLLQRLVTGTHVLAAVRRVDAGRLILALPHGIAAVARAEDVSRAAAKIALASTGAPADGSDSDADSDAGAEAGAGAGGKSSATGLQTVFTAGQYVSCVVLNNAAASGGSVFNRLMAGGDPSAKSKRGKVSVSLAPDLVNDGVTLQHIAAPGSLVWGAVSSKEDHGFVVDLGITGVHSFVPFKNVAGGASSTHLRAGVSGFFTVSSVKAAANSVVLSFDASAASKESAAGPAAAAAKLHSLTSLKPGMLVNASVKKVWGL